MKFYLKKWLNAKRVVIFVISFLIILFIYKRIHFIQHSNDYLLTELESLGIEYDSFHQLILDDGEVIVLAQKSVYENTLDKHFFTPVFMKKSILSYTKTSVGNPVFMYKNETNQEQTLGSEGITKDYSSIWNPFLNRSYKADTFIYGIKNDHSLIKEDTINEENVVGTRIGDYIFWYQKIGSNSQESIIY